MKSLTYKKLTTIGVNLILISAFIFLSFELDNIIIKVSVIPVSLWLIFISIRVLREKSLDLKIDEEHQIILDGILYDHKTYTYSANEFILGYRYIPFLIIEDKFEFSIYNKETLILRFNASTFSKEDRNALLYVENMNTKKRNQILKDN